MNQANKMIAATLTALAFLGATLSVEAGKPQDVQSWSNGFPSGEHHNLNIHGKKADYACDPTAGGGSVFVPEYGADKIDFVSNKKSSLTNLTVHDPCGASFDGDAALVQLPAGEYQVYARILAKPAKDSEPREVMLYPALRDACNDPLDGSDFANATSCTDDEGGLLGLGVLTKDGAFDKDGQSFEREDPRGGKGKGKSQATDITQLFQWSGAVCDASLDLDGDGQIGIGDIPDSDGDGLPDDLDGDGDVDEDDLDLYVAEVCQIFESEWVFNIADLVVSGWDYQNNGSKLLQVRFYPTDTTTFA